MKARPSPKLVVGGTAELTDCTVSGNSAASKGGGLYTYGTATLTNTIVAGQTGGGDVRGDYSGSHDLIGPSEED